MFYIIRVFICMLYFNYYWIIKENFVLIILQEWIFSFEILYLIKIKTWKWKALHTRLTKKGIKLSNPHSICFANFPRTDQIWIRFMGAFSTNPAHLNVLPRQATFFILAHLDDNTLKQIKIYGICKFLFCMIYKT